MINYNERLEELMPCDCKFLKGFAWRKGDPCEGCINGRLKQVITSLIKELVAEARIDELQMIETAQQNSDQWGNFCIDDTSDFSNYIGSRISELEQNLLKALEEK